MSGEKAFSTGLKYSLLRYAAVAQFLVALVSCAVHESTQLRSAHRQVIGKSDDPLPQNVTTNSNEPFRARPLNLTVPPDVVALATGAQHPPAPAELKEIAIKEGVDWFYGPGLGRTILNIAAIVVFPPYAIYLLGNEGLKMANYKPLNVTDALGPKTREQVLRIYQSVTDVPGRVTSSLAGRKFERH